MSGLPRATRLQRSGVNSSRLYTTSAATTRSGHTQSWPSEATAVMPHVKLAQDTEPPPVCIASWLSAMFVSRSVCSHEIKRAIKLYVSSYATHVCKPGAVAAESTSDLTNTSGRSVSRTVAPSAANTRPTRPQPAPSSITLFPYIIKKKLRLVCHLPKQQHCNKRHTAHQQHQLQNLPVPSLSEMPKLCVLRQRQRGRPDLKAEALSEPTQIVVDLQAT